MKAVTILLAFANDREGQFLRNIAAENQAITLALKSAEKKGGCRCIVLPDATREHIIEQFTQNPHIELFHYGGHADDTQLKLNSQTIEADSLAEFLISQQSLQLVFLNGCSTLGHARALHTGGIPATIVTARAINDQSARDFAKHFYENLASGDTITQAYQQAVASTKLLHGRDPRGFYYQPESAPDSFPWQLVPASGSEWKLPLIPQALTPLPLINPQDVIGRDDDLQELEQRLTEANQLLLVNGLGGIGKTTLAKAYLSQHLHSFDHLAWISIQPGEDSQHHSALSAFANNLDLFENLNLTFNP
ncbi:MAG: CHAT domain-containing protein, partial [Bacteroidetes bacterium]